MDIDLPIRGLEPLTPLLAYLIIYIFILFVFRIFLWPLLLSLGRRGTIRKIIRALTPILFRTLLFGGLILGVVWALLELGVGESFYDAIQDATSTVSPVLVIGALGVLVVLGAFRVLTRAFRRQGGKK